MCCVIERTINGATVTHLEQLSNSSFLDSSIQLTDTTAKANWQAAHLPNTNVFVNTIITLWVSTQLMLLAILRLQLHEDVELELTTHLNLLHFHQSFSCRMVFLLDRKT